MENNNRESLFANAARETFGSIGRFAKDLYSAISENSRTSKDIDKANSSDDVYEEKIKSQENKLNDLLERSQYLNSLISKQFKELISNLKSFLNSVTGGLGLGALGGIAATAAAAPFFEGPDVVDLSDEDYETEDRPNRESGDRTISGREITREEITTEEGGGDKFGIDTRRVGRIVDTRMEEILRGAAERFPLRVRVISGYRSNSSGHRQGAMDVMIYDQEGNPINAYQSSETANIYAMYAERAREVQMELYPEFNRTGGFVWGGGWSGFSRTGEEATYGAADYMDFRFNWAAGPAYKFADQREEGESGWQQDYEHYAENDILGIGASRGFTEEDYANLENFVLDPEYIQLFEELGFGTYLGSPKLPPVQQTPELAEPVPETLNPAEPVSETPEPVTGTPEPAEPVLETPEPVTGTPEPAEPVSETPEPVTGTPEPASPESARSGGRHRARPAHVPEISEPAEPVSEISEPAEPVSETPAPVTGTPEIVTETPAPVPESPNAEPEVTEVIPVSNTTTINFENTVTPLSSQKTQQTPSTDKDQESPQYVETARSDMSKLPESIQNFLDRLGEKKVYDEGERVYYV